MSIDDYNLIDQDFEEFMRRGRESFGLDKKSSEELTSIRQNETFDYDIRILAEKELLRRKGYER